MESTEIRRRFLSFFEKRGHAAIPSASLIPENDASVLFTTAGMHPLVPYLLGEEHPKGKRLVDVQKCVRTGDLDDVGDNRHFTFFEMLGNWSLGDYFKEEAIKWSYEFLTSKEEGLGLDPNKLYVTVFEGNEDAPFDDESKKIWMSLGVPEHRIYALGAEDNWWSAGENGPCGPDTEMFYDLTDGLGDLSKEKFLEAVKKEDLVEIWNDVFMEFRKENGKVVEKLKSKNVDTGAGLERMTAVMQGKKTAYDTDLFYDVIKKIREKSEFSNIRAERIIADHLRSAIFIAADGVIPSANDRGYVLRKILRLANQKAKLIGFSVDELISLIDIFIQKYEVHYPELKSKVDYIKNLIAFEINEVNKTESIRLNRGIKKMNLDKVLVEMQKLHDEKPKAQTVGGQIRFYSSDEMLRGGELTAEKAFYLNSTEGISIDLIMKIANDFSLHLENNFDIKIRNLIERHKEESRKGASEKFKGGLAGHSEIEVRYHTATHLLHQALRDVLGNEVSQKGSNITPERLRFDFSFSRKMTDEEKQKVQEIVNGKIGESIQVENLVMSKDDAVKMGALHFFDQKYPDQVSVYKIGDYSKEFCGGPHVKNTGELGKFKIDKEEAVSAGVRRIKATLL